MNETQGKVSQGTVGEVEVGKGLGHVMPREKIGNLVGDARRGIMDLWILERNFTKDLKEKKF